MVSTGFALPKIWSQLVTIFGGQIKTPLKKVVNTTPGIVMELAAMGYHTLEDLQQIGWEKLCISYSKIHTGRLNPEFFTLLYAIVNNIELRKVTKDKLKLAVKLVKKIKAGFDPGFAKKSKSKNLI
jgi:hypothetical protein